VDIWSLGCVFSEAAAWVVTGDFDKHRTARRNETEKLDDCKDGAAFHNGASILRSVSCLHDRLKMELRTTDFITRKVITRVVEPMLEIPSDCRPAAMALSWTSKHILNTAAKHLQSFYDSTKSPIPWDRYAELQASAAETFDAYPQAAPNEHEKAMYSINEFQWKEPPKSPEKDSFHKLDEIDHVNDQR
jgi:hypothetical protein